MTINSEDQIKQTFEFLKKPSLLLITLFAAAAITICCRTSESFAPQAAAEQAAAEQPAEACKASLPFSKGVNFSSWFEAQSARAIIFTAYTEQDFINAKSLGVEVIRLPIRLHDFTSGSPLYSLDPLFLQFLDQAVDWAEKHELYLILDNHSFDPVAPTASDIGKILLPVWAQIAQRYKNRSSFILYEILNEPHGINSKLWAEIQGSVIKAIREIDPVHSIIAGGAGYNSIDELFNLPKYPYENIIYTFHFYDPYLFTHQGETWGAAPNLRALKGLPFPGDAHSMPKLPSALKGTWIEKTFNSYKQSATVQALAKPLDKTVKFSNKHEGFPLFCGEFGVYIPNSLQEDRVRWYEAVTKLLDERGIARTSWDYYGGFGIFKTPDGSSFENDLNTEVAAAMGFSPPVQKPAEKIREAFSLFDNYPITQFVKIAYWNCGLDLYHPNGNKYAIEWGNANRYGAFMFNFTKQVDWEYLSGQNYALTFTVKADKDAYFDVRFVNKEDIPAIIPWRLFSRVKVAADGNWHNIRIPLNSMLEQGAWINASQEWRNPQGKFSWANTAKLEFVAEEAAMAGINILFDTIKIEP